MQLDVTPKVEGVLKLVGIRWTLSNSVVGYQYFEFDAQKKNKKGKKGRRRSLNNNLVVIKVMIYPDFSQILVSDDNCEKLKFFSYRVYQNFLDLLIICRQKHFLVIYSCSS